MGREAGPRNGLPAGPTPKWQHPCERLQRTKVAECERLRPTSWTDTDLLWLMVDHGSVCSWSNRGDGVIPASPGVGETHQT